MKKSAIAPGKIILSGEHAVVYGAPALALAVNRLVTTEIFWQEQSSIDFNIHNLNYHQSYRWHELLLLQANAENNYQEFLTGKRKVGEILAQSFDLLAYAFIKIKTELQINIPNTKGVRIDIAPEMPIGCGMGSSAAMIISLLKAMIKFFQLEATSKEIWELGRQIENLQHGHSSGIDIYLAIHGGCIKLTKDKIEKRASPKLPMQLINTGKPLTSTGESVSSAAHFFKQNQALITDFTTVTEQLDQALQDSDLKSAQTAIGLNHKLLCEIGVVPQKVQQFIKELEKLNLAGKICGAGAVSGDNAGMLLVMGENNIGDLVQKFNYETYKNIL